MLGKKSQISLEMDYCLHNLFCKALSDLDSAQDPQANITNDSFCSKELLLQCFGTAYEHKFAKLSCISACVTLSDHLKSWHLSQA